MNKPFSSKKMVLARNSALWILVAGFLVSGCTLPGLVQHCAPHIDPTLCPGIVQLNVAEVTGVDRAGRHLLTVDCCQGVAHCIPDPCGAIHDHR